MNRERSISSQKDKLKSNQHVSECLIKKISSYYQNYEKEKVFLNNTIYSSHEGLLLNYEECFIRKYNKKTYAMSGHLLWIGQRTLNKAEAHVEFFRHVENPIGLKVSNKLNIDELIQIIRILNPDNESGKIVIITRFGLNNIEDYLNNLCVRIKEEGLNVLFICDPNHGNTKVLEDTKVRYFDEMINEITLVNNVLTKNGLHLSGIHLEASCFRVTECIGGLSNKVEKIEKELYTTYCDPRLNIQQVIISNFRVLKYVIL
jgi:3-deoxy-7-phosphoheptulonate synthase